MNDHKLQNKRILIFQQRGWGVHIGNFLALQLSKERCKLAALTFKRTTDAFIRKNENVRYEMIINNDDIMEDPKAFLGNYSITLDQVCVSLGIDSVWPMVSSLRNYVRSYEDKYYYGFKQNVSDKNIILYVKAVYICIRKFFVDFDPEAIIAPNFVTLPHIMFNLYAKKRGVPMIAITDTKVRGRYIFTHSFMDDVGYFNDHVRALNSGEFESKNAEKAKKYLEEFRHEFKNPDYIVAQKQKNNIKKFLKDQIRPFYQILRWYIVKNINHVKILGITQDNKPPRIILRDHYMNKYNKKRIQSFPFYDFSKIEKFVYFPLQFQPEQTIDVIAPYFNNFIEIARQVAMSLPGDYTLVVKEHPSMVGLRSASYYEKILRTPNVKLVDYRISPTEILKKADLVVSPSGTTIAEAAFYNKPAIQLGDLGTTLLLPNVFGHKNMSTLSSRILEVLDKNLNSQEYEKKLINYIAASYDIGFDVDYVHLWTKGEGNKNALWKEYEKEFARIFSKSCKEKI